MGFRSANKEDKEASNDGNAGDESLANISAEIDKLNAEMEQIKPDACDKKSEQLEQEVTIQSAASQTQETQESDHVAAEENTSTADKDSESDERMKESIALLLAETTVPLLNHVVSLKGHVEAEEIPVAVTEEVALEVPLTDDDDETETESSGNNILMQVEGGETYMVVWEPDNSDAKSVIIDPSSLPAADLENLFQIANATQVNDLSHVEIDESDQHDHEQSNET